MEEGIIPEPRCPCVQARTEHNKAGSYLVETVRTLEAEAEDSRKAVAAVLALDRTDVYSSTQTWVLDKIGMGTRVGNAPTGNDSHRKVECAKAGGLRATEEVFERVGAVQEEVTLAEVSHRRAHRFGEYILHQVVFVHMARAA